jgi:hypothetical protein
VNPEGLDMPPIHHQLRRRPGGDLKATEHVHELEPLPRPHTSGSFSTISHSQYTSIGHDLAGTHFSGQSLGSWRIAPLSPNKDVGPVSLLATHSSQPNLRPSFEAQVSELALLPEQGQAGGIEDALMKLEGRVSTPSTNTHSVAPTEMPGLERQKEKPDRSHLTTPERKRMTPYRASTNGSIQTEDPRLLSPMTEIQGASIYHLSSSDMAEDFKVQSIGSCDQYDRSEAQDSGAPILPGSAESQRPHLLDREMSPKSVTFVEKIAPQDPDSLTSPKRSDSNPKSGGTSQGSFLLDDNESLSDISTEIADQSGDDGIGMQSFFFDDTVDEDDVLPRSSFNAPAAPPTPPSTVGAPMDQSPQRGSARTQPTPEDPKPLQLLKEAQSAPGLLSPNLDKSDKQKLLPPLPLPSEQNLRRVKSSPGAPGATHLPFVLAFESEVVAEQLTIIEKDALDEVDWKDLIGLNWHQSPPNVRNWVEYLKTDDCTGVDIVVARFNLVVKWVVSECLLTESPSERARCVTKFIHIATHCRRFRNYASMYQIILALLSADLARLHRTWSLVAPAEKQKLSRLEKLCQPLRNFQNLRLEMESTSVDDGCIPFIGLYTHDLMFNAQKPSRIEPPPPAKEPLINFERYQRAATIVKSLLRLIEASAKYVFHPHPEVLSRCLWLAALDEGEIGARSRVLEA